AVAGTLAYLPLFLRGAGFTVVISVLAMAIAIAGGLVLSVARRYGGPVVAAAAGVYVELFRGTPVLLQLYVLYYGLAPLLTLDAFTAAVVGLGLNYAAYESQLYRAGPPVRRALPGDELPARTPRAPPRAAPRARARMTVVTVRGLQTRRGATEVLRGIDLEVRGGEVVAVVGPSGSGKTTLLRALNYLTPFHAGEVEIRGHAR